MSLVWYRQIKGMLERGTGDLATIDAAEARKYLTAAEATDLRAYWQLLQPAPEPDPEPTPEPETPTP